MMIRVGWLKNMSLELQNRVLEPTRKIQRQNKGTLPRNFELKSGQNHTKTGFGICW